MRYLNLEPFLFDTILDCTYAASYSKILPCQYITEVNVSNGNNLVGAGEAGNQVSNKKKRDSSTNVREVCHVGHPQIGKHDVSIS